MFPFFLAVFPEVARNLVRYRILTLPGARTKAREYGYTGAFFAWESQDGGHDACTHFNIDDVFTGRPMRTYFRDKQIHISADVAWAVGEYVRVTGETGLLWNGGWECMLECVRFLHSYAYRTFDDSHYVLADVTGPDEYHERVANNAYTNYLTRYVTEALTEAGDLLREEDPERYRVLLSACGSDEAELARLRDFAARLFLPAADPQTGLIEQFSGYFRLEDCSLAELRSRILQPTEYLGGGNGLATTTRILKQADVVLLLHLLGERFSSRCKKANWHFYEPRTEHGSSLSACAYALVAAEIGEPAFARDYFLRTASIDLEGKGKDYVGNLYIGGTHPAANGGAWMVAVLGFAGLRLRPDGLHVAPRLPAEWTSLRFAFSWRGQRLRADFRHNAIRLAADPANTRPVPCDLSSASGVLAPGQVLRHFA